MYLHLALFGLILTLTVAARRSPGQIDPDEPGDHVLTRPISGALALSLFLVLPLHPLAPNAWIDLVLSQAKVTGDQHANNLSPPPNQPDNASNLACIAAASLS